MKVKLQSDGWNLDGMSVPNEPGNRHYQMIQEWIAEGNIPEPEFTQAEIDATAAAEVNASNLAYLEATDFKMTVDYYATLTVPEQDDLTALRATAREAVRVYEI